MRELLEKRIKLLIEAAENPKVQAIHLELCKRSPVYWFNNFCWTYDPRKPDSKIPFVLYDYQEFYVQDWMKCIDNQEDFCIEKSRDMGVSWLLTLIMQYRWLFIPGQNFHVGGRKAEEVDRCLIDPAETVFGKFRYNLYNLPTWMQPPTNDKEMNIQNLTNGNNFTGESSNPNFGRGARKTAILFDELSAWEFAEAAWASAGQTTNCRIANGTPLGESNKYAKILNAPNNELILYPHFKDRLIEKEIMNDQGQIIVKEDNWPLDRLL